MSKDLKALLINHIEHAMPGQVDRDYAKHLLNEVIDIKVNEARIDELQHMENEPWYPGDGGRFIMSRDRIKALKEKGGE